MEVRRSYRGRGKRDRGENFNFNLFIVPLGVSPVIISVVFCSIYASETFLILPILYINGRINNIEETFYKL